MKKVDKPKILVLDSGHAYSRMLKRVFSEVVNFKIVKNPKKILYDS